jgi:hypothetical protein
MSKTILTILTAALLAASTVQIAAAAQHYHGRNVSRIPMPMSEPIRNSNAFWVSPYAYGEPYGYAEPAWSRYTSGALSAPAGR